MLFAGSARVREVGPAHLTFTAAEAVEAAHAFAHSLVVPLHVEAGRILPNPRPDWPGIPRGRIGNRLRWPPAGRGLELPET